MAKEWPIIFLVDTLILTNDWSAKCHLLNGRELILYIFFYIKILFLLIFFFHFNLFTHTSIFRCLTSGQEFKIPDKNKSNNSTIICIFNIWARAFKKRSTLNLLMDADVKKSLQTLSTFSIPYIFYPYSW